LADVKITATLWWGDVIKDSDDDTVTVADVAKRARILDAVRNKKMPDDLILQNTTRPAK